MNTSWLLTPSRRTIDLSNHSLERLKNNFLAPRL